VATATHRPSALVPAPPPLCFKREPRCAPIPVVALDSGFTARQLEALAGLLPVLGCGEEAATIAFSAMASHIDDDPAGQTALRSIASDEALHDRIIMGLRATLPTPPDQSETLRLAKRFHISLGRAGIASRLARIAALDSAVCSVLSALLRRNGVLAGAPNVLKALKAIWQDEARHVTVSRRLALARASGAVLRPLAFETREALAEILLLASDALEVLEVDPARMGRIVRQLPAGLLP
jgi:hypothetical protein